MNLSNVIFGCLKQTIYNLSALKTPRTVGFNLFRPICWHLVRQYVTNRSGMNLSEVVNRLQKYASPSLAASWDNVGLLVEPSAPHVVSRLLLTNDLTQEVADEAVSVNADMILSYHPLIFQPFKRLTQKTWKERVLVKCMEKRIAVYSPHTSYDVLCHGITDWLIAPFAGKLEPITAVSAEMNSSAQSDCSIALNMPDGFPDGFEARLKASVHRASMSGYTSSGVSAGRGGTGPVRVNITCPKTSLGQVVSFCEQYKHSSLEIVELVKTPIAGCGFGRIVALDQGITVGQAVDLIKAHLKLTFVRLALGSRKTTDSLIRSVAVCAGSGGSVLRGVNADLYLTGEMSHHEVLDAVQNGTTVVLCDHSNTERGFLANLQHTLNIHFDHKICILISENDRDPLEIV